MNAFPPNLQTDYDAVCASEPIHRPGAIQPHGLLFVLRDGSFVAASANAPGPALGDLLETGHVALVTAELAAGAAPGPTAIDDLRGRDGRTWLALLHHPVGAVPALLELEPSSNERASPLLSLNGAIAGLQAATDIASACAVVAAALSGMTGFDRVMAYRFMPDWSGDVLAEHLARPDVQSFLGLRFPASDIPAQARALYASARVRSIADCLAQPVPLAGADQALDIGACAVRAVSPIHLQYLANMGVRASMSVAIVTAGGTLWGLLACHHEQGPLFIGHLVRRAADTLARALAWRVAELEATAAAEGRNRLGDLRETLATRIIDPAASLDAVLSPLDARLRDVVGADRFVLTGPDGMASGADARPGLAAALEAASADGRVVTDRVRDAIAGPATAALEQAGHVGLLAFRLSDGVEGAPGTWVAWLRRELVAEVEWAGNPAKHVVVTDGSQSLSPRHSFAAWREEVAGRSAPFTQADVAGGAALAEALTRALLKRADAVEHANADLRRRNDDIRFFADAAVHDLREPLWQIQVFSGMLSEELGATEFDGSAELQNMARIVEGSAVRMRQLIDELASFAAVGRRPERIAAEPLRGIVDEAATDIGEQLRACGGTLLFAAAPSAASTLVCDRVQIRRLFQNLFSNAMKYRDPERPLTIRVNVLPTAAGCVSVEISDNGLGFDPADAHRIFEPFRRLSNVGSIEGMGLGLAICRRIAEGHAGSIEGHGQPGVGARFVFAMPTGGPPA